MIATFPYALGGLESPLVQLAFPMVAELHFSPTILGLPALLTLLLVAGIVAVFRPSRQTLLAGVLGVVLVAAAAMARPDPTRLSIMGRCAVESLMDHPETAQAICEEAEGRWHARPGVCALPRN